METPSEMSADGELLERERELSQLTAAIDSACAGTGRVVVIEGDAGVGKSRLLAVAAERARCAGMQVLSARGLELERDFPFGVALQLLEPPLAQLAASGRAALLAGPAGAAAPLFESGLATLPDSVDRVYALVHGLRWLVVNLTAGGGEGPGEPLLLAVDDVHWSDVTSLRFLTRLAADIDMLPVALVIAVRSAEPETPAELIERLSARARVLRPAALSEQAVARLVRASYPAADDEFLRACSRTSAGNPFYLQQLLESVRSDGIPVNAEGAAQVDRLVPAAVLRSVLVRMARLPARAAALACAVAILGDRVLLRQAASLAGLQDQTAERAADALAGAHILLAGDPLAFAHPLISAAIREDMPAMERSRAHRRAADLLGAEGAPIEAIAVHLLACRPAADRETTRILRAAAERATGRGEHQAARRFLARALAEPPPADARSEVEIELALVAAATGAPDAVRQVVASLELLEDPRRRARTLQVLARLSFARSDFATASEASARARGELADSDPLARELLIDQLTISLLHNDPDPQAAARLAAVVQAAGSGRLPAEPVLRAMLAGSALRSGQSAARVRELASAALDGGDGQDAFYGLGTGIAVMALIYVDALDLAGRPIDAALQRAQRVGSLIGVGFASHWRAQLRYHQGALAEAIADANQTLEVCRSGWDVCLPWVVPLLARAYVDGGDLDAAASALALCNGLDEQHVERAFALDARAHLALARADPGAALADFEAAGALADRHGITQPTMLPWRSQAALASLQLGDQDRAAELAGHELAQARKIGARRTLGGALRIAGLTTAGQPGLELLNESVAMLERSPAALQRAQALADLGAAQRRAGHRTAAREPLQRALQLANQVGAAPLATRAADELHAAGGRRRASRQHTGPAALTATERRVAQLAAQGLGTPQIAHTLYVTPKTVEWHLGHIYQKLAINSRHQLADALSQAIS